MRTEVSSVPNCQLFFAGPSDFGDPERSSSWFPGAQRCGGLGSPGFGWPGPKPGCSSRFRGIFILPGLITPIHTAVKWLLSVISCWILICRYHNPPNKDYTLYKVGFPKAVPQTRCNHTLNVRILIGDSWNLKLVFFVDWWTCSTCRNCSDWGSAC